MVTQVPQLPKDTCSSIGELWDKLISRLLPAKEILLQWHKVLMEYVERPDAMFVIRGGNSAKKNEYDCLRRGFLTRTDQGYSFFYTDNFHAAYFLKMAMDGYVPTVDELLTTYNSRQFPSRFGSDTEEERELMAMPRGKNPGFQSAGYKLAHIYNVGIDYMDDNRSLSLIRDIVKVYYPYGARNDWKMVTDSAGTYYERFLAVKPFSRRYLVAAFLRFVHPFNYFLTPKKSCSDVDVSENPLLISFVRNKMKEMFGTAYDEFLGKIMPPVHGEVSPSADTSLHISYALNFSKDKADRVLSGSESVLVATSAKNVTSEAVCSEGVKDDGVVKAVRTILESGMLEEQEIDNLMQKPYCREKFGLNHFPLLSINPSFWNRNTPVQIGKKVYYLNNQLGEGNIQPLKNWLSNNQKKSDLQEMPIGKYVRSSLWSLLESGAVDEQEIKFLLQQEYCKDLFGLGFAMLSREREFKNGLARYYKTPLKIRNEVYYLTSQWYPKNRILLEKWMARFQQ